MYPSVTSNRKQIYELMFLIHCYSSTKQTYNILSKTHYLQLELLLSSQLIPNLNAMVHTSTKCRSIISIVHLNHATPRPAISLRSLFDRSLCQSSPSALYIATLSISYKIPDFIGDANNNYYTVYPHHVVFSLSISEYDWEG